MVCEIVMKDPALAYACRPMYSAIPLVVRIAFVFFQELEVYNRVRSIVIIRGRNGVSLIMSSSRTHASLQTYKKRIIN